MVNIPILQRTAFLRNAFLSFLFVTAFPVLVLAQNTPLPPLEENLQKFLNVPVWYLNYRIELTASGNGSTDTGSWNASTERFYNGTMELGLRSQGPSLSMSELAMSLTTPDAMDRMFAHYVNWMAGASYDDKKTDAENEANLNRALEASSTAMASWHYSYYRDGTCGPNHGQAGGNHEILVGTFGTVNLEFDAEKKKYNFMFVPIFGDTDQSLGKVQGSYVINEGCEKMEARYDIKDGFFPGYEESIKEMTPPWDNGPSGANIVEDLPTTFGPISGSFPHAVKVDYHGNLTGSYNVQYTLSPFPPEPVELFIIPPPEYDKWRPMGDKDEKTSGDTIPIEVKLQKQGGGDPQFKAIRFNFKLKNTSREKGVCMNMPKIPDPNNPFDLQFEKTYNPDHDIIWPDNQVAIQGGDKMTEGYAVVSSFDYGAYGDLEVTAELENGQVVYGVVKGTGEKFLKLPKRKVGSDIAEVFLKNLGNLPDTDDNEDDPVGDGFKGDGLSLYEEYRGFIDGANWITGDPKKKDVFVYNQMRGMAKVQRGISVYENATKLVVHRHILTKQVNSDMVINFNNNPKNHIVDQHVIRLMMGRSTRLGGRTAHVEKVGTPGTAKSVTMPVNWEEFRQVGARSIPSWERTQAHEMSHSSNLYHHGQSDETVWWVYEDNPVPQIVEVNGNNRMNIFVYREDGTEMTAAQFFPANTPVGNGYEIQLGIEHGQHSGAEECLMRYWVADAYKSNSDPQIRYLSPGEIRGTILCNTTAGTGVNAPSHRPQSRYGSAATPANGGPNIRDNRGKCKDQLRINDLGPEPKR